MMEGKTLCVLCAWRAGCNKKFSMDGATTTRCPEYTRDVTLKDSEQDAQPDAETEEPKP